MKTILNKTTRVLMGTALIALVAGFSSCNKNDDSATPDVAQSAKMASTATKTCTLSDGRTLTFTGTITDSNGNNVEITEDFVNIIGSVVDMAELSGQIVYDVANSVKQ